MANDAPEIQDSRSDISDLRIKKDIQNLTSSDAQKVAMLFNNGAFAKSRSTKTVNEVEVVNDMETSSPLIYVVNFDNNEGFSLVSATKNTYPVLAYSETGNFDSSIYNETFEDLKTSVRNAIQYEGDSLRTKYSLDWALYENVEQPKISRAMGSGTDLSTDQLIQNEIARKEAEGYNYIGQIAAAQALFSAEEYANLVRDISSHTNPAYNYEEVSLLFIKYVSASAGPYLKTNWHQGEPFNVDAPNGLAGCVPIAIAQIAYYYKYPPKYNWSNIAINPVNNEDFNYFIKDIRNLCNVSYDDFGTSTTFSSAKNALTSLGYQTEDAGTPTFESIKSHMTNRQGPIVMFGVRGVDLSGHAWVCDGFQIKDKSASISYISSGPTLTGSPYDDYPIKIESTVTNLVHQNGGFGNSTTAWYLSTYDFPNNAFSTGDYFYMDQRTLNVWK